LLDKLFTYDFNDKADSRLQILHMCLLNHGREVRKLDSRRDTVSSLGSDPKYALFDNDNNKKGILKHILF
jgi:hypothetical protein